MSSLLNFLTKADALKTKHSGMIGKALTLGGAGLVG